MPIKSIIPHRWSQRITIIIFIVAISYNMPGLIKDINRVKKFKLQVDEHQIGYKFANLPEFLKNEKKIGYYTNIDITKDRNSKDLAHAQYMLAPAIVDNTSLNYRYVLLICSDPQTVVNKMKELRARPIRVNKYGMVLAERAGYK